MIYLNSTWLELLVGVFGYLHRKISDPCVCNIAGINQTSENVGFPDVSANSVLVLCMRLLSIWDVGICLSADRSSYLLYRHRKMSAYMFSNIQYIIV